MSKVFISFVEGGEVKVRVKFTLEHDSKTQRGSIDIGLLFKLGARWGCVVKATPRPFYLREIPGTHCIGSWVGFHAGLDW